ncbi:ATP-binding protein [Streptomyces sp. SID5475]|nr:ATP-binding protein [Streptomyces sp. SID5475]
MTPATAGTARPAPGTLPGRSPGGKSSGAGHPGPSRRRALTLVFAPSTDGDRLLWPREARAVAVEQLKRWGMPDGLRDRVELVVSELVTNAVSHGEGRVTMCLTAGGAGLRVTVADESPLLPVPRDAGPDQENGRGLLLVAGYSNDYGVDPDGTVWAWFDTAAQPATT